MPGFPAFARSRDSRDAEYIPVADAESQLELCTRLGRTGPAWAFSQGRYPGVSSTGPRAAGLLPPFAVGAAGPRCFLGKAPSDAKPQKLSATFLWPKHLPRHHDQTTREGRDRYGGLMVDELPPSMGLALRLQCCTRDPAGFGAFRISKFMPFPDSSLLPWLEVSGALPSQRAKFSVGPCYGHHFGP